MRPIILESEPESSVVLLGPKRIQSRVLRSKNKVVDLENSKVVRGDITRKRDGLVLKKELEALRTLLLATIVQSAQVESTQVESTQSN